MKILITGASGFLGNALVRRLAEGNEVLALARNEGNLLKLKQAFPSVEIMTGDIANPVICREAMVGIEEVYHLAGFKHVGLAEIQPKECISTNVYGSELLLTAALEQNVRKFIAISTDKAANISGVYGASKFLMEGLMQQFEKINPATKYRTVRYGNVLYSTGSVLCAWRDLLQRNQPITITDPSATRFFWTVDQAVDLIFECLAKATDAKPYHPKMKAIRMGELLKAMLIKYGDGVYRVKEVGLGPGENLHETLDGKTWSNEVSYYTAGEILGMI